MLKDRDGDTMRSHKGRYKVARAGWYNIRVRRSHGPDARWDELDVAVKDEGEGLGGKEEVHEEDLGDDFDKYLQEQAKAEADRKFEEEVAAEVALEKAEKGSNSSGGSWDEEDPFAAVTAIDRTGRSQVPLIDPRSIPEDRETLTNILSGGERSLRLDGGDGGRETVLPILTGCVLTSDCCRVQLGRQLACGVQARKFIILGLFQTIAVASSAPPFITACVHVIDMKFLNPKP